jgi:Nucleoside phosphorylase
MNKKFLFVTANKHETEALLKDRNFFVFEEKRSFIDTDANFYNVGKFGNYDVVHFELINQGSTKADASILAIYDAIEAWHPDAVILVGIAFGKDNEDMPEPRQHIGDILISKMVVDYESEKIKDGMQQSDGFISESGRHLISVFQHYSNSWNYHIQERKVEVTMGLILSGDKVVDDKEFKSRLFSIFPRAIGGEMEGRGAYSACRRKGIEEWIIVKAICDWGVSKAGNKAANQIVASESAVSFLRHIFLKPEAFDKLPTNRNNESGLPTGTITDVPKPGASENNEQSRHDSINVSDNKAENMVIARNVTINGGLNFGRKQ